MEMGGTALAFYGLGAAALAASLVTLKRRLQLSKAKHGSLAGHARIARRIASFVPFYEYEPGEVTMALRDTLTGIQRGTFADTHGWMVRLDT